MPLVGKVRQQLLRFTAEVKAQRPLGAVAIAPSLTPQTVVALTTFPQRLNSVTLTLRTILRQTVMPDAIVVILSSDQFPGNQVPDELKPFVDRGVQILFDTGDIRSYKKLLPARESFPSAVIVTADDDVLYPNTWFAELIAVSRENPEMIIGHRGTRILGSRDSLRPYVEWPQADTRTESSRLFLTGMGGILYPPNAFTDVALDRDLAVKLCPTADDIWFKAMGLLSGTVSRKVSDGPGAFHTVRSAQRFSLRTVNVTEGRNEEQFRATMDHFDLWAALDQ